jgi:hypothetical protein
VTHRTVCVAIAYLCIPFALLGQAGRHGGSRSGNNQTAPADNPDLTDFKRAIAVQATDEQTTRFKVLAQYTEAARQQVQAFQQAAPPATVKQATALQDSLDDVQRAGREFLKTFSDAQVSGLKKQTKKLSQSDAVVAKEMKKLSALMDRTATYPQSLHEAAMHLDQALATLQSDQNGLAKEMGIGTQ